MYPRYKIPRCNGVISLVRTNLLKRRISRRTQSSKTNRLDIVLYLIGRFRHSFWHHRKEWLDSWQSS